jgi:seryl-tRNA synthetase
MLSPEVVVDALRARGWLWETAPGVAGLRGPVVSLMREIECALQDIALRENADEWVAPPGVAWETLERARYFASFPQWLTCASHLSGDHADLERIAASSSPAAVARESLSPGEIVLPPAICYNTYAALAGSTVTTPVVMTAQGTCWRHEGARVATMRRAWAFTMREIVCVGSESDVKEFLDRSVARVSSLERALGLECELVTASDPFFAPTARGQAALQRIKGLKHELEFRFSDGSPLAIASFNDHEVFFGEAFGISLADGSPAWSGCAAFGLERWLLAALATHGLESIDWAGVVPAIDKLEHEGAIDK